MNWVDFAAGAAAGALLMAWMMSCVIVMLIVAAARARRGRPAPAAWQIRVRAGAGPWRPSSWHAGKTGRASAATAARGALDEGLDVQLATWKLTACEQQLPPVRDGARRV